MNHYQLICKSENQAIYEALLEANNLTINTVSKFILCEEGSSCTCEYDFLIYFKKDKFTELIELLKGEVKSDSMMMGRINGNYVPIDINEIVFFNAFNNDTFANTLTKKTYKIKYKLYELEKTVLPKQFIRINKSEIVNVKHISKIIPMFKGNFILQMEGYNEQINISRNFIKNFKERIGL